jgi:hypothetical protein
LGDAQAAAESLQQARALAETLCLQAADAEVASRFLVNTLLDQADHALRSGDLNRAREAADTARIQSEGFASERGATGYWSGQTAACWDRLGEVARATGAPAQAQDAFGRAVEFRRLAHDREPQSAHAMRGVSSALLKVGEIALHAESPESARAAFSESTALRMRLFEAEPDSRAAAHGLAAALERLGLAAMACGDRNAARGAWEDELMLADRIFGDGDSLEGMRFRAIVEAHLASAGGPGSDDHRRAAMARFDVLARAGALTEAEAALRRKLWGV